MGGGGRKSEGSTADTARKRPERPWTAARTTRVLRRCPLAIAQRLVHCAIAVSTAVLGQSHKDNVRCTAVEEQPRSERSPAFAAQLHLPAHDLFWANLRVQLHLPPLDLARNPYVVVSSCLEDIPLVEFMHLVFWLHACCVRVTVDDSGFCCCVCVTSFGMKPKQEESTHKGVNCVD